MTFPSEEIKDYWPQRQDNETNTPEEKYLTKEEIGVLYNYLKNEFITYDNEPLYQIMKKICDVANERMR